MAPKVIIAAATADCDDDDDDDDDDDNGDNDDDDDDIFIFKSMKLQSIPIRLSFYISHRFIFYRFKSFWKE